MIVAEGAADGPEAGHGDSLQWGRNMIVAEGSLSAMFTRMTLCLQWGRNMIVAEGGGPRPGGRGVGPPSMGPQHDSCGRLKGPPGPHRPGAFNGAAT